MLSRLTVRLVLRGEDQVQISGCSGAQMHFYAELVVVPGRRNERLPAFSFRSTRRVIRSSRRTVVDFTSGLNFFIGYWLLVGSIARRFADPSRSAGGRAGETLIGIIVNY